MATHFFHSGMVGAPTNTNAAGSTLAIIRAVLSTGFNLLTPQSATVASGVMTLTYSAPHGYEDKVLLRLDGAPGGSVVRRVTASAGSSSLTIPAPGFADGAVSGSLSTRVAPAGWEEVFTGAGVGVFRSTVIGPGSTRFYYRVADTVSGSDVRTIRGFESMTDANTGTGPFPTTAQETGNGVFTYRMDSATPMDWVAVVDGRTCYVGMGISITKAMLAFCFGDFAPLGNTDSFAAMVAGGTSSWTSSNPLAHHGAAWYSPRNAAGSSSPLSFVRLTPFGVTGSNSPGSGTMQTYPSPIDGGMVFVKSILAHEELNNSPLRGVVRGLMFCSANPLVSSRWMIINSVTGINGRVVVFRDGGYVPSCVAFPIDEDWA